MIYWDCLQQNFDVIQNHELHASQDDSSKSGDNNKLSESHEFSNQMNIESSEMIDHDPEERFSEIPDSRFFDNIRVDFDQFKRMPVNLKYLVITDIQANLWLQHTKPEEIYEIWFNRLNTQDRMRLWNSLDFPQIYFEKLNSQFK